MRLRALPQEGLILMYTSEHVGALQKAGDSVAANDQRDGLLSLQALRLEKPAKSARWVVATEGDVVYKAVAANPEDLTLVSITVRRGSHVRASIVPKWIRRRRAASRAGDSITLNGIKMIAIALLQGLHSFHFDELQQMTAASGVTTRLLVASLAGRAGSAGSRIPP